ncbi:MAG: bactofilin family protein [Flavisolibacter sp.]
MFNKEKSSAAAERPGNSATLIAAGTTVKGDVHSSHDLRIDGCIQGNVSSTSKIVVGATGTVEGNIEGVQADIAGRVQGNISVKELLQLRANSTVDGNISADKLQIDASATFNGECRMGSKAHVVSFDRAEDQVAVQGL